MISIMFNGGVVQYRPQQSLTTFITEHIDDTNSIAAAVNQAFVPRARYDEIILQEGDEVELLSPMMGG